MQKRKKLTDMKAQELRIGNYVSTPSGIQQIIHIEEDCFYSKDFKNKWAEIKPIALTEEWLVNFGFEEDNKIKDLWHLKYECNVLKKRRNFISVYFPMSKETYFYFKDLGIKINQRDDVDKYVHELQNLYFALTCEELKLATAGRSLKAYE